MKKKLDLLCEELSNGVYMAALIYERAEGMGLIFGNGHHMAQQLALEAVDRLRHRFHAAHPRCR